LRLSCCALRYKRFGFRLSRACPAGYASSYSYMCTLSVAERLRLKSDVSNSVIELFVILGALVEKTGSITAVDFTWPEDGAGGISCFENGSLVTRRALGTEMRALSRCRRARAGRELPCRSTEDRPMGPVSVLTRKFARFLRGGSFGCKLEARSLSVRHCYRVSLMRCAIAASLASFLIAACSAEIGSDEWCAAFTEKPKTDWTAQEVEEFSEHCNLKE